MNNKEDILIEIFCDAYDFWREFSPIWQKVLIESGQCPLHKKRNRLSSLCPSEIITIVIFFHFSRYRTFKDYYNSCVLKELKKCFPGAVSYSRFVNITKSVLFPIFIFLQGCLGDCTGISFIDSTILTVCHPRRIYSHRVFKRLAKRGKTSTGWFYGFKLHLIINHHGEILAFMLTPGNVDDRVPVPDLAKDLFGKIFGDRGYISSILFEKLYEAGLQIITRIKSNMKNKLMPIFDKLLLQKRGVIESVNNKLKACCQIEHHRHRSPWNFMVNLLSGLTAYCYDRSKPTFYLTVDEEKAFALQAA
jgi:hypothetical protein